MVCIFDPRLGFGRGGMFLGGQVFFFTVQLLSPRFVRFFGSPRFGHWRKWLCIFLFWPVESGRDNRVKPFAVLSARVSSAREQ